MNWYTQAGPQPDTQLAASMRFSGTGSRRPAGAMSRQKASSSSAVTLLEQYWIMPSPTEAGVLGMMRMTGKSSPAISWMRAMGRPAAMLHSTKRPGRSASENFSGSSSASIIWGLTARKIRSHSAATSALEAVLQPSSCASACALDAVRLAR